MEINLTPDEEALLNELAREEGIYPSDLITRLIDHADQERHVVWSREEGKFVRRKCGRTECREEREREPGEEF